MEPIRRRTIHLRANPHATVNVSAMFPAVCQTRHGPVRRVRASRRSPSWQSRTQTPSKSGSRSTSPPVAVSVHIHLTTALSQVCAIRFLAVMSGIKHLSGQLQHMGRVFSKLASPTEIAGDPRVPQELVDQVLDHLADDTATLQSCSLVAKSWIYPSRRHLFNSIFLTVNDITKWNTTFPNPEDSPAGHVRDLSFCFIQPDVGINFADRFLYFSNVQKLTLIGRTAADPGFISGLGQLPPSIRSVDITFSKILTVHIISMMQQLPNLENLSLMSTDWGGLIPPGTGKLLQARLSGKLRLRRQLANRDLLNMLMEIPTGPRFAEVEIRDARMDCFPATLKLVRACQDTLTKLHFSILVLGTSPPSLYTERSR